MFQYLKPIKPHVVFTGDTLEWEKGAGLVSLLDTPCNACDVFHLRPGGVNFNQQGGTLYHTSSHLRSRWSFLDCHS